MYFLPPDPLAPQCASSDCFTISIPGPATTVSAPFTQFG